MKIRNEIWAIRINGTIVPQPATVSNGDLLVVYTETLGFEMQTSAAVITPIGKQRHQKRMSFSYIEATTFPSMLAAIPKLALKANVTVMEMLVEIGYINEAYAETSVQQMLDAILYATQHEKQLNAFEIVWTKI